MNQIHFPISVRKLDVGEVNLEFLLSQESTIPRFPRDPVSLYLWLSKGRTFWVAEGSADGSILGYIVVRVLDDSIVLDLIEFAESSLLLMPKLPEVMLTAIGRNYYRPRRNVIKAFLSKSDFTKSQLLQKLNFRSFPETLSGEDYKDCSVWKREVPENSDFSDACPDAESNIEFIICDMDIKDSDEILDIQYLVKHPGIKKLTFSDFYKFVVIGYSVALVAKVKGVVVGSIVVRYNGGSPQIVHIAVHPKFKRRGIASALLDEVERILCLKGIQELEAIVDERVVPMQIFLDAKKFKLLKVMRSDLNGGNDSYLFRKHFSRKTVH